MRTHPGISGKSDFGESNHKVAEFIFWMRWEGREMLDPNQLFSRQVGKPWGSSWGSKTTNTVRGKVVKALGALSCQEKGRKDDNQPWPLWSCCKPRVSNTGRREVGTMGAHYSFAAKTTPLRNHTGRDERVSANKGGKATRGSTNTSEGKERGKERNQRVTQKRPVLHSQKRFLVASWFTLITG